MCNHRKQLISIRVDPVVLSALDNWKAGQKPVSRSEIINNVLHNVLGGISPLEFVEIVYNPEAYKHLSLVIVKKDGTQNHVP